MPSGPTLRTIQPSIAKSLPVWAYAFCCSQAIPPLANELLHHSRGRMDAVIWIALALSSAIFFTVAELGYATFGAHVSDSVLDDYAEGLAVTVARIAMAVLCAGVLSDRR